ncbi:MAG: 3-oxoacyl-[acyl-carrier-protein] synthase III C-terminal domain-containing protein [Chlamydiota bacterium]
MQTSLTDFSIIRPKKEMTQEEILTWMAKANTKAEGLRQKGSLTPDLALEFQTTMQKRLFSLGLGEGKIQKRAIQALNYLRLEDEWPVAEGMTFKQRSHYFDLEASQALEDFYKEGSIPPAHLIHVSCTGYVAPSSAQKLVSKRNFGAHTNVTHAYHMGCYASIPAIRIAQGFLQDPSLSQSQVDIVHTELCTLHINPLLHEPEQLVVQTLFADGFIKYSVTPKSGSLKKSGSLDLLSLHEEILPSSTLSMSWVCENFGMQMTLAKDIPSILSNHITKFLHTLIEKGGLDPHKTLTTAFYAIHPGGPKVIQKIAKLLALSDEQTYHSKQVLYNFGNMSSATLPHIWEKMVHDPEVLAKSLILSLAFGPGLTISGALYEKGEV